MWLLRLQLAIATALSYCSARHRRPPPDAYLQWSLPPLVLAGLALPVALYSIGMYGTSKQRPSLLPDRMHIAAFFAGIVFVFIALCSPVETLGDTIFSMHMVQHVILMMVAPPLLVWSYPWPMFCAAFSPDWRQQIAQAWTFTRLDRLAAFIMHPVVVWILFCGSFVFWHLPFPYDLGLNYELAHLLEHASFFFTALAFWTLIIEPSGQRRLGYAATLLYLVVTVIISDMPGALMVLSPRPLYPIHAAGAESWGLSLMQDQQLAGLIMWIPAGAIYIAAAIWLFLKLLQSSEERTVRFHRSALAPVALLFLPLLLGGCGNAAIGSEPSPTGGDPHQGAKLIGQSGCGACHTIPGIGGANGLVGPPLNQMGKRVIIAGVLRNTPDNMVKWLRHPQAVVPNNAMPDMGLDEQQARDITAYLYTLN
jgi:putative membrane protein